MTALIITTAIAWSIIVIFLIALFGLWALIWSIEWMRERAVTWTQCAWCRIWKSSDGRLSFKKPAHIEKAVSHGICPDCFAKQKREIEKLTKPKHEPRNSTLPQLIQSH